MPGNLISEFSSHFFLTERKNKMAQGLYNFKSIYSSRSARIWKTQNFPGGPVVKNLPANAGAMDSVFGPGRSHMPQGNSVCVPSSHSNEKPRPCNWRVTPHLQQLEKAHSQQWRPRAANK